MFSGVNSSPCEISRTAKIDLLNTSDDISELEGPNRGEPLIISTLKVIAMMTMPFLYSLVARFKYLDLRFWSNLAETRIHPRFHFWSRETSLHIMSLKESRFCWCLKTDPSAAVIRRPLSSSLHPNDFFPLRWPNLLLLIRAVWIIRDRDLIKAKALSSILRDMFRIHTTLKISLNSRASPWVFFVDVLKSSYA